MVNNLDRHLDSLISADNTHNQTTTYDIPLAYTMNRDFIGLYRVYPQESCIKYQTLGHGLTGAHYSQVSAKLEHCTLRNISLFDCVIINSTLEDCKLVSCCIGASTITDSSIDLCQIQGSTLNACVFMPGQFVRMTPKHRYTFNDVHSLLRNCNIVDSDIQKTLVSRGSTITGGTLYLSDAFDSKLEGVIVTSSSLESCSLTRGSVSKPRLHCCTVNGTIVQLEGLPHEVTTAPLELKRFPVEIHDMILDAAFTRKDPLQPPKTPSTLR